MEKVVLLLRVSTSSQDYEYQYNTLKELIVGRKEVASYYQGLAEAAQNKLDTLIESFDEWQ